VTIEGQAKSHVGKALPQIQRQFLPLSVTSSKLQTSIEGISLQAIEVPSKTASSVQSAVVD
jgi:hypothetical protein